MRRATLGNQALSTAYATGRCVEGKVLRETIQVSSVWQSAEEVSGHSPRLWGWRGWLGLHAGGTKSPLREEGVLSEFWKEIWEHTVAEAWSEGGSGRGYSEGCEGSREHYPGGLESQ